MTTNRLNELAEMKRAADEARDILKRVEKARRRMYRKGHPARELSSDERRALMVPIRKWERATV